LIKEKHENKEKSPIQLSKEFTDRFEIICEKLKNDLIGNAEELMNSNMKFIEERVFQIKIIYIFFNKLLDLSNAFQAKSDFFINKYKEINKLDKVLLKSEIVLQDKFLEYNYNIDKIIYSIDNQFAKNENEIDTSNLS